MLPLTSFVFALYSRAPFSVSRCFGALVLVMQATVRETEIETRSAPPAPPGPSPPPSPAPVAFDASDENLPHAASASDAEKDDTTSESRQGSQKDDSRSEPAQDGTGEVESEEKREDTDESDDVGVSVVVRTLPSFNCSSSPHQFTFSVVA